MRIYIIVVFSLIGTLLSAQNNISPNSWYEKEKSDQRVSFNENVNYNIFTGTSFSSFGRNNNVFSYYVSPSAQIPVGKDFTFTFGVLINQTQYSGLMSNNEGLLYRGQRSMTQSIVYASGAYRVNPNVTVYASGYYDTNARNTPMGMRALPNYNSYGTEGFSVGAEFKIGTNSKIGIHMQYDKGVNPYFAPYGSANNMFNRLPY